MTHLTEVLSSPDSAGVCDFCANNPDPPNPGVMMFLSCGFDAMSVQEEKTVTFASTDEWFACTVCGPFVERSDLRGLISVNKVAQTNDFIKALWITFFAHRHLGPPAPYNGPFVHAPSKRELKFL